MMPLNARIDKPKCFAAGLVDEKKRWQSASGGVFRAVAEHILSVGGCVFGSIIRSPDMKVVHVQADSQDQLDALCGVKYVVSDLGDTFRDCKRELVKGRFVFFTGTPCQINALKKFLGEIPDNLLTADLICHGTPDVRVFDSYKEELCRQLGGPLTAFAFRSKTGGTWSKGRLIAESNGSSINIPYGESPYIRAFSVGLSLRPCCFNCRCKGDERTSDITLGDFWGVDRIAPEYHDEAGVSLVVAHTGKGLKVLRNLGDAISLHEVRLTDALRYNRYYQESMIKPRNWQAFMDGLEKEPFVALVARCCHVPWYRRVCGKVVRKVRRMTGGDA